MGPAKSPAAPASRVEHTLVAPPAGVTYPEVLRDPDRSPLVAVVGILLGVISFVVLLSMVAQGLVWVFWVTGLVVAPDFAAAYRASAAFQTPWGMLAVHLGLASLIPISLGLLRVVHRVRPVWLCSVKPGFRWGYLVVSMGIALVVLNVVLALSHWGQAAAVNPQPDFAAFVVVILVTSPLQAAAEEFFFRGYLLQALGSLVKARTPWFAVVASALVFALFHGTQNVPLFLDRFGFGVLAGFLVWRTGGLEAAIGAHIVNNVLAFTYAGLFSTIAEVKAVQQVGWVDLAWDLAGFGVFTMLALLVAARWRLASRTPGGSV